MFRLGIDPLHAWVKGYNVFLLRPRQNESSHLPAGRKFSERPPLGTDRLGTSPGFEGAFEGDEFLAHRPIEQLRHFSFEQFDADVVKRTV